MVALRTQAQPGGDHGSRAAAAAARSARAWPRLAAGAPGPTWPRDAACPRWIPGSIAPGEPDPCDGYPNPSRPAGLTPAMDTRIHRGKRVWIRVSIALLGRGGQMNSRIHRTRTRPFAPGPAIRTRTRLPAPGPGCPHPDPAVRTRTDRPQPGRLPLADTAGRTRSCLARRLTNRQHESPARVAVSGMR